MKTIHCDIHNSDIKVYDYGEEYLFIDDNRMETAIFTNEDGSRYLMRFVDGKCDEFCLTVREILNDYSG